MQADPNTRFAHPFAVVILSCAALCACAPGWAFAQQDELLHATGFQAQAADTPARQHASAN